MRLAALEAEEAEERNKIKGPRLVVHQTHLSFNHAPVGQARDAACKVTNVGTTALFYRWSRAGLRCSLRLLVGPVTVLDRSSFRVGIEDVVLLFFRSTSVRRLQDC